MMCWLALSCTDYPRKQDDRQHTVCSVQSRRDQVIILEESFINTGALQGSASEDAFFKHANFQWTNCSARIGAGGSIGERMATMHVRSETTNRPAGVDDHIHLNSEDLPTGSWNQAKCMYWDGSEGAALDFHVLKAGSVIVQLLCLFHCIPAEASVADAVCHVLFRIVRMHILRVSKKFSILNMETKVLDSTHRDKSSQFQTWRQKFSILNMETYPRQHSRAARRPCLSLNAFFKQIPALFWTRTWHVSYW
jgi:hypothetical protein